MFDRLKIKKYFFFKAIIFSFIIYIFVKTTFLYQGNNIFFYFIFSIVSNFLIIFAFRRKASYFDIFFSFFLWVGFWLKYSLVVIYGGGIFTEGIVSSAPPSAIVIDDSLYVIIFAILGFIVAGYLRQYFYNYPKKINFNANVFLYSKYRKYILSFFFILILSVFFLNTSYSIFQKGVHSENENFIITQVIKYFLLYGLTTIGTIILYYEISSFKKISFLTVFITILETFLSSISMLSRGMIFNAASIFIPLYKIHKKISININFKFFLILFFLIIFLFYLSVSLVNYLRANTFDIGLIHSFNSHTTTNIIADNNQITNKSYSFEKFYGLAIRRWVGIDSIILLNEKKSYLGFKTLKQSLNEKFVKDDLSFYEKTFTNKFNYFKGQPEIKNIKGNTLPGIVSYFYYSGSVIFVFFSILFFSIFASVIEFVAFKASSQNLFFSCLIGQIIAYRFAHFGYLPLDSFKLFGSIFITILLIYIFHRWIKLLVK